MRALQLYQHLPQVIKRGLFRQVPLVVEHLSVDLDERDDNGRTPIMLCAYVTPETCGVSLARTLIEKGCSLELRDKYGLSVLHYACIYERLQLVRVLLRALQSSANVKDRFGCTPLHYAVRAGNPDITQVLANYFTHYDLCLTTVNKDGKSPLQEAYQLGHVVCAKILMNITSSKNISSGTENSNNDNNKRSGCPKNTTTEEVESADAEADNTDQHPPSDVMTPPAVTPRMEEPRVISPDSSTSTTQGSVSYSQTKSPKTNEMAVSEVGTVVPILSLTKTNADNCLTTPLKTLTVSSPNSSKVVTVDDDRWATKRGLRPTPVSASTSLSALPFETSLTSNDHLVPSDKEPESQIRSQSVVKKEALRKMLTRRSAYVLNQMSKPNEWNVTQLIAPSANDYRNDPTYMMSITSLARGKRSTEKKPTCQTPTSSVHSNNDKKPNTQKRPGPTWRNEIRKLFDHYEYHCSLSYRRPARLPDGSNTADQSGGKDDRTSHGGSGTGSSTIMDRLNRRHRRSSNISRSSAINDAPNQRKLRSRRSSILSQQSSVIVSGTARTGNQTKEYARTMSSDSIRSNASSQKVNHA